MTESYVVKYSAAAVNDLREIYTYIANELFVPEIATNQLEYIREKVRSLSFLPARYSLVEWEPWYSMGMRHLPVGNFVIYYNVDETIKTVYIIRIIYSGRDINEIINPDN